MVLVWSGFEVPGLHARGMSRVELLGSVERSVWACSYAYFGDRFWGTDWPGTLRPRVYYDPRSVELDGPAGVLHAKSGVADDDALFITSANLTEAALGRNIEMGLLVRGRALAASVVSHFRGLIDPCLLHPLPMA